MRDQKIFKIFIKKSFKSFVFYKRKKALNFLYVGRVGGWVTGREDSNLWFHKAPRLSKLNPESYICPEIPEKSGRFRGIPCKKSGRFHGIPMKKSGRGFRDSTFGIPGFRKGFRDSRISGFRDSRISGLRDSRIPEKKTFVFQILYGNPRKKVSDSTEALAKKRHIQKLYSTIETGITYSRSAA